MSDKLICEVKVEPEKIDELKKQIKDAYKRGYLKGVADSNADDKCPWEDACKQEAFNAGQAKAFADFTGEAMKYMREYDGELFISLRAVGDIITELAGRW